MGLDPMISYTALSRFLRTRARELRARGPVGGVQAEAVDVIAVEFEVEERAVRQARERSYAAESSLDPIVGTQEGHSARES